MFRFGRHQKQSLGWLPRALHLSALLSFAFLDLMLIICLIALSAVTSSSNGFATIGDLSVRSWRVDWNLEILWTSLPVFIFRLLGVYWDWITTSVSQRQPYIDLLKDGGAEGRKTVLLDYLAVPMVWRWWSAFSNKHPVVGSCSLLTLIMSLVISALAANLFVVKAVPFTATTPLLLTTGFDDRSLNLTIDWVPIFDTVSATMVHNGIPIAWTDRHYAFQPYQLRNLVSTDTEVTTKSQAYSASLDCSILTDYQLDAQDLRLSIEAEDRGCDISHSFPLSDNQELYFEMLSITTCRSLRSRLVAIAAMFSNTSPDSVSNLTMLSCIPKYQVTTGDLTAIARGGSMVIQEFSPEVVSDTDFTYWRTFEEEILKSETFNHKTVWSIPDFGSVILYNAQKLDPASYLTSSVLQSAMEEMFTAVYVTAAARHAFIPLETAILITGKTASLVRRLHAVFWTTYVVVAILVLNLVAISVATYHVYSHASILKEEPAGLLNYARLLEKSPLLELHGPSTPHASQKGFKHDEQTVSGNAGFAIEETETERDAALLKTVAQEVWGAVAKPNGSGWVIARLR